MNHAKFILPLEASFLTIHSETGIIKLEIINNFKTKVQIVPYDGSGREMVCTVLGHSRYSLNLKERSTTLTDEQKSNGDFEVSILPNCKQLEYARDAIDNIRSSEALMRKVWAKHEGNQLEDFAYPTCLVLGLSKSRLPIIAKNIVMDIFRSNAGKVLVCAPTNQGVNQMTIELMTVIKNLKPNTLWLFSRFFFDSFDVGFQ